MSGQAKVKVAEEKFRRAHRAWVEVNNAQGFASGEANQRWQDRQKALMELVEIKRKNPPPLTVQLRLL